MAGLLNGCMTSTEAGGASGATTPTELTVFAAASLKNVLASASGVYEHAHPGIRLLISTDSSAALEAKIEQSAPADVFLSADTANPRKLVEEGLAPGPVTDFASNVLTVIVPLGDPAGVRTPADLARAGVKVVAAAPSVPITKYATALVEKLAALPGYPSDFVAAYGRNVVSREDDVAAVVAKVALGEGDAGICYATDARSSAKVSSIPVPPAANVTVTYGGVIVGATRRPDAARAFLAWLVGSEGRAILGSFGFLPAS